MQSKNNKIFTPLDRQQKKKCKSIILLFYSSQSIHFLLSPRANSLMHLHEKQNRKLTQNSILNTQKLDSKIQLSTSNHHSMLTFQGSFFRMKI